MLAVMTAWSPKSVLTFCGIVYFIVLAIWALKAGFRGWGGALTLTCVGVIIVAAISPSSNYSGVVPKNKGTSGMRHYFRDWQDNWHDYDEFVDTHTAKRIYGLYDRMEETKTYAMSLPSGTMADGEEIVGSGGIGGGWFFHPACLFWSPLLVSLGGFCLFWVRDQGR